MPPSRSNAPETLETSGELRRGIGEWEADVRWHLAHPGKLRGIRLGWRDVDEGILGGLEPGNLLVVASSTGEGKSILVGQMAVNLVTLPQDTGEPVNIAFFGVEMSGREMAGRFALARARVDADDLLRGDLSPEERDRLTDARAWLLGEVAPRLAYFGGGSFASIDDIHDRAGALARGPGLAVIIVDYLQRIVSGRGRDSRVEEIGDITSGLKQLAARLEIVVIAISQITRESIRSHGGRAQLTDMSDSSSIEKDADYVLGLWRPARHFASEAIRKDWDNIAVLELLKGRFRKLSTCYLVFNGAQSRFDPLDATVAHHLNTPAVQRTLTLAVQHRAKETGRAP